MSGFTLEDLVIQKLGLEDRIKRIEKDLEGPLEANLDDQANQITNMMILRRLLEAEKSNLRKVQVEIEKRRLK